MRDVERKRKILRDIERCTGEGKYRKTLRDVARYREIWTDIERYAGI